MTVSLNLTPLILPLIWSIHRAVHRMKKNKQLNVRLPNDLRQELERACEAVGLDAATVTRACLQAFVDQVTQTGEIRLPLAIVPKKASGLFPSPARALPGASSLSEETPRPAAVPSPAPAERYSRIRKRAQKPSPPTK